MDVNALLIDPDYPDTMYAGSNNPNGVYKTNDGSLHWQPVNNGLDYQYIMDFAIDPSEPTLFYSLCKANAAASQTYVYCTVDRGAKWFDVTTGIPGEIKAWDLEIDPTVVDPVFAATDKGLYTYTPDFDKHLVSSSGIATDANNGRKLIRICETDHLWTVYESGGVIYAVHSTDRGQTWSKKMEIGRGLNPCVAAQPGIIDYPPMGIAWRRGTLVQDTIYYAYYLGDHAWSNPYMIAVSGGLFPFDPPSLAIDDQGFCHVAYANNGSINHAWFEAMDPGSSSSETIITGLSNQNPKNPCIGFLSSEVNPNLHVVWENDAVIYYSYRAGDPAVWSYSEVVSNDGFLTLNSCHHPSLEISGDVVYVVWDGRDESANQDIYWRNLSWIDGTPYWSWIWYVCSTEAASEYPVLASGFYCSWVEDGNEVYYAYYDPFMWVWTGQTNLSQSANLSGYPHLAYQQTWDATHIYFIWTENNTAPYHIEFRDIQFGGGGGGAGFLGESGSDALGFYSAEAGKETKSAFNLKRTGIKNYGNEPYKKADYDDQYLEYKFSNLNPDKDYGIKVKFYQHGNNNLPLTVKINNVSFGSINIPQDSLITFQKQIPAILYKNKVIDIKIYGSQALSGTIVLYEYERDKPKGGGSQDANTTPLNGGKLGLNIYPVPAWNDFTIDYVLPYKISIRICLYDVSGRLIAVPVSEARRPGRYEQRLKTDDLPQGVYFLRFEAGDQVTVRKVTVLK